MVGTILYIHHPFGRPNKDKGKVGLVLKFQSLNMYRGVEVKLHTFLEFSTR
jgi:hypothetical protein